MKRREAMLKVEKTASTTSVQSLGGQVVNGRMKDNSLVELNTMLADIERDRQAMMDCGDLTISYVEGGSCGVLSPSTSGHGEGNVNAAGGGMKLDNGRTAAVAGADCFDGESGFSSRKSSSTADFKVVQSNIVYGIFCFFDLLTYDDPSLLCPLLL